MRVRAGMRELLPLGPERRWRRNGQARHATARKPPERRGSGREDLTRIDAADDDDHERLGHIVTAIEARERLAREAAHQLGSPDNLAAVSMAVEELRVELTSETATRIVVAQAHLLEDDFLFLLQNVYIERRVHRDVGQHFEAGHQALRRQRDVV